MVSLAETTKAYHGYKASTYEEHRVRQKRWHDENAAVEKLLRECKPLRSVLDMPCGTGRFFGVYRKLKVPMVIAVDASESMLEQARKRARVLPDGWSIMGGDATKLNFRGERCIDVSVCVRFFHLIDEASLRKVFKELDRVTRHHIVFNIKFGAKGYRPGVNSAHHDREKFWAMTKRAGWSEPVIIKQKGGWETARISR